VNGGESLWDVFISHASEDKDELARPLFQALTKRRLKVWYDEKSMMPGDKLVESIERGIKGSNYGVIIVSKDFLNGKWTKHELGTIFYKAVIQDKPVFTIWHKVTLLEVQAFSLDLAKTHALRSEMGIDKIADELVVRIKGLYSDISSLGEKV
jgi:hypothetical protein